MHNAENEVTQEDLAAVDTIGGHMASYYEFGQSDEYAAAQEAARDFRLASTRDLEAEVERLKAEKHQLTMRGLFLSEKYKREICGLEAQLAEARGLIAAWVDWEESFAENHELHPFIGRARAALAGGGEC